MKTIDTSIERKIPRFTQKQKESLSEKIYGHLREIFIESTGKKEGELNEEEICKINEELSRVEVEFKYNTDSKKQDVVEESMPCSDGSAFIFASLFALRCIPGSGNGCWPGYKLG